MVFVLIMCKYKAIARGKKNKPIGVARYVYKMKWE